MKKWIAALVLWVVGASAAGVFALLPYANKPVPPNWEFWSRFFAWGTIYILGAVFIALGLQRAIYNENRPAPVSEVEPPAYVPPPAGTDPIAAGRIIATELERLMRDTKLTREEAYAMTGVSVPLERQQWVEVQYWLDHWLQRCARCGRWFHWCGGCDPGGHAPASYWTHCRECRDDVHTGGHNG